MSPVWIRKRGLPGTLVTSFSASENVPVVSGLAGLSKPRWLSLTCTKLKSVVAASALPISRARGTPPTMVQTIAVPAQVMHSSTPRRPMAVLSSLPMSVIPPACEPVIPPRLPPRLEVRADYSRPSVGDYFRRRVE